MRNSTRCLFYCRTLLPALNYNRLQCLLWFDSHNRVRYWRGTEEMCSLPNCSSTCRSSRNRVDAVGKGRRPRMRKYRSSICCEKQRRVGSNSWTCNIVASTRSNRSPRRSRFSTSHYEKRRNTAPPLDAHTGRCCSSIRDGSVSNNLRLSDRYPR